MEGGGIKTSDLLIVRQQPVPEKGETVVALLDGEATVKRLAVGGGQVGLQTRESTLSARVVTCCHSSAVGL